jgi:sugar O-acyltransferase (sialic acid O-acetyltransferase NeuD family)
MINSSAQKVILVGYSGHAFVAAEAIILSGYEIMGYLEKFKASKNLLDLTYLGYETDEKVLKMISGNSAFIAIGDNFMRQKVFTYFVSHSFNIISVLHPKANISSFSKIGKGTLVCQGAQINPFTTIGDGVIINTGAIIEHECIISDFSHIAPGAVLAGNVSVDRGSFVGANAVIKQGVKIGSNATIGAGSVVLNNIEDYAVVAGNPAKSIKK